MVVDVNYWTKVIRKVFIMFLTIVLVYIGFKLAIFYLPFLIEFIISLLLEPAIRYLMKKLKLTRKKSSIIVLILITLVVAGIVSISVSSLITEGSNFLGNINEYVNL